jgi:carboxymethylenebutenolidase
VAVPGAVAEPATVVDSWADIVAADGHRVPAFVAEPAAADVQRLCAIVVIAHAMGVDEHIRDVTRRFAAQGFIASAPELFARLGGPPRESMEEVMRKLTGLGDPGAVADLVATASWLRAHPRGNGRVASIGFCMGGRLSLLLATQPGVLDRAIDCWGGRITRRTLPPDELHPEVVVERISQLSCPLLGIFGELDENPSPADVEELRSALLEHGKEHRIRSFAGAGHAFFADTRPSYREEQAHLAWKEFLDFLTPLHR